MCLLIPRDLRNFGSVLSECLDACETLVMGDRLKLLDGVETLPVGVEDLVLGDCTFPLELF